MLFLPNPGDLVLDIGANDGAEAVVWAAAVGPTGRVWAVEPHPEAFLKTEAALKTAATLLRYAVTDMDTAITGDGLVTLYTGPNSKHSSLLESNVIGDVVPVRVPAITLDTLVSWMPRVPEWVKIDAQGAEAAILSAATETLDARRSSWVVEIWPNGLRAMGASLADVLEPFQSRGYVPSIIGRSGVRGWDAIYAACASIPDRFGAAVDVLMVPGA